MLFHTSVDVDDPKRVAQVIAELWGGKAFPFPGVLEGSWIALAGDENCTALEVYPRSTKLFQGEGPPVGRRDGSSQNTATHLAIASVHSVDEIFGIADREGWDAKIGSPGNAFELVEIWVEGHLCVEAFSPDQQKAYLSKMSIPAYEREIAGWLEMAKAGLISREKGADC